MLRTKETRAKYAQTRVDRTVTTLDHIKPLRVWKYWKLVENEYPYDKIAKRHHMLIPLRTVKHLWRLEAHEVWEIIKILLQIGSEYNFIMLALSSQSVQSILHFHLLETYDKDEDFKI